MNQIKIGWAQTSITPSQPALMEGQMYQRCSRYVHDPITATALALDNGETRAIFVSNDMTEVPVHAFAALKAEVEKRGIDFSCVSINVTHSHNSTSFYRDFLHEDNLAVYDKDILPEFEGRAENMLEGDEGIRAHRRPDRKGLDAEKARRHQLCPRLRGSGVLPPSPVR